MKNIMILSFLLTAVLMIPGAAQAADPVATVVALEGSVTAKGDTGRNRKLDISESVYLNDNIQTEAGAKLQILFTDDSLFAMGEKSEVTITEYLFDPKQKKKNGMGMKMGTGMFRVLTGKIATMNPERFTLKSARATIGIRGCELAFILTPKFDKILMFFIPKGKEIYIEDIPDIVSSKGAVFPPVQIFDQGTVLYLSDTDKPRKSKLSSADIRDVMNGTTPGRGKSHGDGEGGGRKSRGQKAGEKGPGVPGDNELVGDLRGSLFEEDPLFDPPPGDDQGVSGSGSRGRSRDRVSGGSSSGSPYEPYNSGPLWDYYYGSPKEPSCPPYQYP